MNFLKECLNGRDRKNKVINCMSMATIASAFILIVMFFYWSLYPYNPVEINERPARVKNRVISKSAKEPLIYTMDVCKHTELSPDVIRRFSDGIDFQLQEIKAFKKEKGCRVYNVALDIPETLPSGEYILVIEFTYHVNPIRDVTVTTHTQKFIVTD